MPRLRPSLSGQYVNRYWKNHLKGNPYHISALYVVDLDRFRQIAAGDRLRQQYQALSADPHSLANLDQDLPNNMQGTIPIVRSLSLLARDSRLRTDPFPASRSILSHGNGSGARLGTSPPFPTLSLG